VLDTEKNDLSSKVHLTKNETFMKINKSRLYSCVSSNIDPPYQCIWAKYSKIITFILKFTVLEYISFGRGPYQLDV
jgi:hypothetical protein